MDGHFPYPRKTGSALGRAEKGIAVVIANICNNAHRLGACCSSPQPTQPPGARRNLPFGAASGSGLARIWTAFSIDSSLRFPSLINRPDRKNLMKKQITYTAIALFATLAVSIAATPDQAALEAKEKAAWQAFKDKKPDDFKKVVAANFVGVYDAGISDMQKELSDMQKWDMKSFTISDYHITSVGPNLIISSYKVTVEGTYDGKDASGTYNAGSVWHGRGGNWQAVFHTNVKEAAAGPGAESQKKE